MMSLPSFIIEHLSRSVTYITEEEEEEEEKKLISLCLGG